MININKNIMLRKQIDWLNKWLFYSNKIIHFNIFIFIFFILDIIKKNKKYNNNK
jgi:hypothetical protein